MASIDELQTMRGRLFAARASGVREVMDSDGERIVYRTDNEMAAAIRAIDLSIVELTAGPRPSVIRFATSKGL